MIELLVVVTIGMANSFPVAMMRIESREHPKNTANRVRRIERKQQDLNLCERRKKCYSIYKNYTETVVGTISGIIHSLEAVAERDRVGLPHTKFSGYHCQPDSANPNIV